MSKRPAQDDEQTSPQALKAGERPIANSAIPDGENFEDEFEDEFESEDEILEAGVDGRPDEEREAEERESMLRTIKGLEPTTNASRWYGC